MNNCIELLDDEVVFMCLIGCLKACATYPGGRRADIGYYGCRIKRYLAEEQIFIDYGRNFLVV